MSTKPTVNALNKRWEQVLAATEAAVSEYPVIYRELKTLARDIAEGPMNVPDYQLTTDKFAQLLKALTPEGGGTIFGLYHDSLLPSAIQDLKLLRRECRDLLIYLGELDLRLMRNSGLRAVK